MNRISREFANECEKVAKKMCPPRLAKQMLELDREWVACDQSGVMDASIKGWLPWMIVKEKLDFYMAMKLAEVKYEEDKRSGKS